MPDYNDFIAAIDNHNVANGDTSWFEKRVNSATNFGEDALQFFTRGVPSAVVSGVHSILNSGIAVANVFGTDIEPYNTYEVLKNLDSDLGQYYEKHKEGADIGGFAIGMFIPGTAGIKALNAVKAGHLGKGLGKAANFMDSKTTEFATLAKAEYAAGNSPFSVLNKNTLAALASGYGSATLEMAAFNTAVAAAMFKSPILENQTFTDLVWNDVKESLLFGGIGGVFKGFQLYSQITKAGKAADEITLPFRLIEVVPKDQDPALRVLGFFNTKFNLPEAIGPLPNTVSKTGLTESQTLDLITKERVSTLNRVDELIRGSLNELAGGDAALGAKFYEMTSKAQSFDEVAQFLLNAKNVSRISFNETKAADEILSLNNKLTKEEFDDFLKTGQIDKLFIPAVSSEAKGFEIVGDMSQLRVINAATNSKLMSNQEAFDLGYDVVRNRNGTLSINPESTILKSTDIRRPSTDRLVDLENSTIVDKAFPTLGDLSTKERPVTVNGNTVSAGNINPIHIGSSKQFNPLAEDYTTIQARYVWAQETKINWEGFRIAENDLPLLEKLYHEQGTIKPGTTVYIETASGLTPAPRGEVLKNYIHEKKYNLAQEMDGLPNQEIAIRLNTTEGWLEGTGGELIKIKAGFDYSAPRYAKMDMALDTGTYPMLNPNNHTAALEYARQVQLVEERAKQTFANFAQEDFGYFPEKISLRERKPTREGAGATLLGFANANYLSLGSWAQAIGQQVDKVLLKRKTATTDKLQSLNAAVTIEGKEAIAELSLINNQLLRSESRNPYVFHPYDPQKLIKNNEYEALVKDINFKPTEEITIKNNSVAQWLRGHQEILQDNQTHIANLKAGAGIADDFHARALYGVPIDTSKLKHFVMVKPLAPVSLDDKMRVIAAKDEATLIKLMEKVDRSEFDVITKGEGERFHKAINDYQYALGLNSSHVDSALPREGKLSQFFPELGGGIFDRSLEFHMRQQEILTHSMVHARYAQQFEELRYLGERYANIAESQFVSTTDRLEKSIRNPYNDVVRTALNVSRTSEYQPWVNFNNFIKDSIDRPINKLRSLWTPTTNIDDAFVANVNKISKEMGQGMPFKEAADIMLANSNLPAKPWIQPFVAKANAALSTTLLQWDTFNAVNNIVSTSILAAPELNKLREAIVKQNPDFAGKLAELGQVKVPGQNLSIPSASKLLYNATADYIKQDARTAALIERYQNIGAIGTLSQEMRQALDAATINYSIATQKDASKALEALTQFGRKWTGNNLAEEYTRFVSAHSANQITDVAVKAGVITEKEANEIISLFTNRTQGNYLYSQRPIVFQGVVGQAIGLFQTYQFNLMQQLFKHVTDGNGKALAMLGGLQTSIYGTQGLPAFNFINHHIVGNAAGNVDHKDLYYASYSTFGKEVGNWMLYGLGSNALGLVDPSLKINLYSRGDINPRQVTVLPTQIEDIPIVAASTKFVGNIFNTFSKVANGGDIIPAITQGIEHNGISRPLAGLGQIVQGYSTTSKGSLLAATQDFWNIATLSRLGGAKPFEESLALDANYRFSAYKAKDSQDIAKLGAAIKSTVIAGGQPSNEQVEQFAAAYAKQGGKIEGFNKYFANLILQANQSQMNKISESLNGRFAQQMQVIMGGERLPDFMGQ